MDTSKIIKGVVNSGRYTVTAPIVKEDYGLYLQIEGVELPQTYEMDFSNSENSGTSVTMIGNSDGVLIPHQFIDTGKDIFAFLYHVGENFGRTVYKFRIPNKVRPDRTNEEPTPEEQSVIDQAISALNTAVAKTAQDRADADVSAQNASADADRAEEARTDAQNYANNAQASATSASQSATASANSATASAQSASQSAQIKSDVESLADDAQGYAQASAQSATASANSATTAQGFAQSASASAQSASGYASNAQSYSQTASAKAQDASQSATTASQKATESAQSATTASNKATEASGYATASQTAQGLAESARDSAISAKTDAESAKDDAVQAKEDAESAVASISGALADKADVITDTASGAIASFSDGADNLPLKSLIVDINPIQDLSHGDPSPENICPISGWTQVVVEQRGKNLLKNNATNGSANGVTWTINSDGSILFSGTATATTDIIMNRSSAHLVIGKGQMALVSNGSASYNPTITGINFQSDIYVDGKYVSTLQNGNTKRTFSGGLITVGLSRIRIASGTVIPSDTVFYPQIEIGNAPSAYEPYTGHSINIQLGQTVYGGHLDVLSGMLTIEKRSIVVDSTKVVRDSGTRYHVTKSNIGDFKSAAFARMNKFRPRIAPEGWNTGGTFFLDSNNLQMNAYRAFDTRAEFIEEYGELQLCYTLATPIEIQLTPHEVNSLLGQNNIWADSGDTEVEYRADTKAWIQRKIAEAIASLT